MFILLTICFLSLSYAGADVATKVGIPDLSRGKEEVQGVHPIQS
jgi:hypothetical protein